MTNEQEALMGFYVHHLQEENRRLLHINEELAIDRRMTVQILAEASVKPKESCAGIKKAIHDAANVVGDLEGCHYEITRSDEDAVEWIEAAARTIMAYRGMRNMGMK